MADKSKSGREAKKPKAEKNKKTKGQAPAPTAVDAVRQKGSRPGS